MHCTVALSAANAAPAVPAPGQLSLFSPPADGRHWVSMHLAKEVHCIICQHYLVHRLLCEYRPL